MNDPIHDRGYQLLFPNLIENNELLGDFALHFKYLKIVENEFSSEHLLKVGNIVSTLFLAETHYDYEQLTQEILRLFKQEDRAAISLFINWFKQLSLRERIDPQDYQKYEQLYRDEQEVGMLITALRKERETLYQQGKQLGLQEGMTLGVQEGAQKNAREVAKAMLSEGLEIVLVAKIARLSRQEIEQLQQN
jgi:flagellar biosynthesis/type III secretory pathway protein FliH